MFREKKKHKILDSIWNFSQYVSTVCMYVNKYILVYNTQAKINKNTVTIH